MKSHWLAICLLAMLVLYGCSQVVSNSTSTNSTKTLPAIPDAPTRAPTIQVVPTQTSTQLPPISTTPTVLSAEDAKQRLFDLLQTNGDCNLPCLLGFTTQVTSKQEIQSFLNQFVEAESPNMSILKTNSTDFKSIGFYIDMYFDLGISIFENENEIIGVVVDSSSHPNWEERYKTIMQYYMLPQILTTYGKPSEVLIWTLRDDPSNLNVTTWPFFLSVIYPEQGIFIKYEMVRQTNGDNFIGCPSKSFIDVGVWNPKDENTFNSIVQAMNNGGDLSPYKQIDEVTTMTVDVFHETFAEKENTKCIETPIELWPKP